MANTSGLDDIPLRAEDRILQEVLDREHLLRSRSVQGIMADLGTVYAEQQRQSSQDFISSDMTDEERLRGLHRQFMASNESIRATLDVVRDMQRRLHAIENAVDDLRVDNQNSRAVQRNGHSYKLNHKVHRISKRGSGGRWAAHPRFPKTVCRFRRLNGMPTLFLVDMFVALYLLTTNLCRCRPGVSLSVLRHRDCFSCKSCCIDRFEYYGT